MKSLFQSIRAGVITKEACEAQLAKNRADKGQLTKDFLARKLGADLYQKKLAEINFAIALLETVVLKYDDFKMPLKTKPQRIGTEPDAETEDDELLDLPHNKAYDNVSGIETRREIDDEGPNFSTEG